MRNHFSWEHIHNFERVPVSRKRVHRIVVVLDVTLDVVLDVALDVILDACRTVRREKSIESGLLNVSETKVKSKKLPDLKFFSLASQRASSYCSTTIVGLLY